MTDWNQKLSLLVLWPLILLSILNINRVIE